MRLTQYLSIEFHPHCNLSSTHAKCPNTHPERYSHLDTARTLDDDTIVDIATRFYNEFGFQGMVTWHYYNEPLVQAERMCRLVDRIREKVPQARFALWTNGLLLPVDLESLRRFEKIHITEYKDKECRAGYDRARQSIKALCRQQSGVHVHGWPLDTRRTLQDGPRKIDPCGRMFVEFIIGYHGNVHLCCYDWRGLGSPGNVFTDDLAEIVQRWRQIRDNISGCQMTDDSPDACLRCPNRQTGIGWKDDAEIYEAATEYMMRRRLRRQVIPSPSVRLSQPKVGVVFVHYAIPERRLREHFEWNDELYRAAGASVYVVADTTYSSTKSLPYVKTVVVPESRLPKRRRKRVFSLALTKNEGIKAALRDGCDVVIVTDTDVAFSDVTLFRMASVTEDEAIVPVYLMARSYGDRAESDQPDVGMTGTIAMTSRNWRQIRFNETCVGYGAEDGKVHEAIRQRGIVVVRDEPLWRQGEWHRKPHYVWHIAHDPSKHLMRQPGHGSADCWNRDIGFNPDNFVANRRLR